MARRAAITADPQADAARSVDLLERLGRLIRTGRKAGDLNELHWQTLRFLAQANRFSRNPGGLAAWLGKSKATASLTVEALARQGLILRLPDPRDGRGLALDLTNGGRRMAEKDPLQAVADALAALPASTRTATQGALTAALASLACGNGARGFRTCTDCRHFCPDAAPGETGGPHRCGLMEEPLNEDETHLVCAVYEATDAA